MKQLTKGKIIKNLWLFAIPVLVSNVVSQSYNLIDLIMAGKLLSDVSLGVTGCSSTLIQFLSSVFWGFGVALQATVGQLYGKGNNEKIVKAIKSSIIFMFMIMALLSLVCIIFSRQILTLLKVDPDIFEEANTYLRIYLLSFTFTGVTYQLQSFEQAVGSSKYSMYATLICGALHIVLNFLFITKYNLGTKGLAISTTICSFLSFLILLSKVLRDIKELGGNLKFEFSLDEIREISYLSVPCILQQAALYSSSVLVQPIANSFGKYASGGYSIANNLDVVISQFYHSISSTIASFCAQSKGAKLFKNFSKGIKIGLLMQMSLCIPICILIVIFPNEVAHIFLSNKSSECIEYVIQYIYICTPFIFFAAYGNLMHSFYKGVAAAKSVLISTIVYSAVRVALTYLFNNMTPLYNLYLAKALAWCCEDAVIFIIYLSKKWLTKEEKETLEQLKTTN